MNLRRRALSSRPAFTLIELMISIAIVLVLMLGINFVFGTSSRTISTGMALTGVSREIRGARRVFENDFANSVSAEEMPAMIIHNEVINAFRDRQDRLADYDGNPRNFDANGEQNDGDEIDLEQADSALWGTGNLPGVYNFRRHRVDRISFFVRNATTQYPRQTGDQNTYVSALTSPEAWISYGLLRLAENNLGSGAPGYWKPGEGTETTNPNNFYASQWILGRKAILLLDPGTYTVGTTHFPTPWLAMGATAERVNTVTPTPTSVAFNRETPTYQAATPWRIEESRVDMASTTIAALRSNFAGVLPFPPPPTTWWQDGDEGEPVRDYTSATPFVTFNYLSFAKPFIDKTNFATNINNQTREAALTTPIFVRGCTQFIVEFAGDFYDQGPDPVSGTAEPLGTIDFVESTPGNGESRIRWYGMTRDTDGDLVGDSGTIDPDDANPLSVEPVSRSGGAAAARFDTLGQIERPRTAPEPYIWAWQPTLTPNATAPQPANNVRPSLIRITLELIDPNARLADGQRIEFIFPMKTVTTTN